MKQGFTLSEVLITLSIVGIVAVLTIPGVMKNYKNRLYTAQLQKVYAQITDAAQAVMNDNHVDDFYESKAGMSDQCSNAGKGECEQGPGLFLNNYFKPVKRNCLTGTNKCFADSYTTINAENAGTASGDYCIQTVNGAAICAVFNAKNSVMSLLIDINGTASPNVTGRDVFSMDIKSDGTVSDYASGSPDPNKPGKQTCDGKGSDLKDKAAGCMTTIIEAGWKMEY